MKYIKLFRIFVFAFILIGFFGSECENKYGSGPAIAWTGGSVTYSYNSGALAGFRAIVKFEVTDDKSGEIKVTASHGGEDISYVSFVEPGVEYRARVYCSISSEGTIGSILIESPSAEDPFTVTNRDYKVSLDSITIN